MPDFSHPTPISKLEVVFSGNVDHLLPAYSAIPKEFKDGHTKWNKVFSRWFYSGLTEETKFAPKDGINQDEALSHVAAIMKSWAPKHEHKEAGCAYLLSLWFEDITLP